MTHSKLILAGLPALGTSAVLAAAVEPTHAASPGGLFQVLLGLVIVLALMGAAVWTLKRVGAVKAMGGNAVRIVSGVNVGNREKVLVVEVGELWIVVGVAPGRVNALATMPRQESVPVTEAVPVAANFAAWLKQTIDKRNRANGDHGNG